MTKRKRKTPPRVWVPPGSCRRKPHQMIITTDPAGDETQHETLMNTATALHLCSVLATWRDLVCRQNSSCALDIALKPPEMGETQTERKYKMSSSMPLQLRSAHRGS